MKTSLFTLICLAGLLLTLNACAPAESAENAEMATVEQVAPNTLTDAEKEEGWRLLFDGESFDGWRGLGRDSIPSDHWIIEDGTIRKVASGEVAVQADGQPLQGGDIITEDAFGNYEFKLEWKADSAANSGIKYNVSEEMSTAAPPTHAALGFEMQILDDDAHPDAKTPRGAMRTSGALYDMISPSESAVKPIGEWNEARIVFNGTHGEHWLNGVKVVEYDLDSEEFAELLADSKYAPIQGFADRREGHIVLQDHGDNVWFRNIKIREL